MRKFGLDGTAVTHVAGLVAKRTCKFCSAYAMGDGLDVYSSTAEMFTGNAWDTAGPSFSFTTYTRFGYGKAITSSSSFGGYMFAKGGFSNENTWFGCAAFVQTVALGAHSGNPGAGLLFGDGASYQCSVYWCYDGSMKVYAGDRGVLQATWSNAFVASSYDHYQVKVIIHPTAGEVHIRKNGALSDSFAATGLNTRGGTANSYANKVGVGTSGSPNVDFAVDDVYFFNGNSASDPHDWVGDIRAIQLQPTTDTAQKQFSGTSTGSLVFGSSSTSGSNPAISANIVYTAPIGPVTQGGTFTTATAELVAGFTGNLKYAIYESDGNTQGFFANTLPGHLLATSNTIVNPVTGVNTVTFASPVNIQNGYTYFLGILTDTAFTHKGGGSLPNWETFSPNPFGSGFPSNLATLVSVTSNRLPTWYTTLTAQNAGYVSDQTQDGLTTYLHDNVVNHYDLYNLKSLNYTPANVIGVNIRAMAEKSDAGARGLKISGNSNVTPFDTAEFLPLTTFGYWGQYFAVDPDTAAAWTVSALNALQIGPKISS